MTTKTARSCSAAQRRTSFGSETQRTNPLVGPSGSALVQNTHGITTGSESLDSSWDVGPSFWYWPLQVLDRVRDDTPRPVQWMTDFRPEKTSDPGFSPVFLPNAAREDSNPPVGPTKILETSTLNWKDQNLRSPYQPEGYAYSENEFPGHLFHNNSDLTDEPLNLEVERFIDPYDPRCWSPPSTATPSPMLANQRAPSPRSLESPPASPPISTSQQKGWNCPECGKHFHERVLLRKHVRYHVQPYNCPTCKKGFSFTKDLKRHQQTHGHGGVDVKELLSCNFDGCRFKFKACRSDTYKRHCRLVHGAKHDRGSARGNMGDRRKGGTPSDGPNKSSLRFLLSD